MGFHKPWSQGQLSWGGERGTWYLRVSVGEVGWPVMRSMRSGSWPHDFPRSWKTYFSPNHKGQTYKWGYGALINGRKYMGELGLFHPTYRSYHFFTNSFRYLKWSNPQLYKLYVRLMENPHPQNSLIRHSPPFFWCLKLLVNLDMDVSENSGILPPKMDGENHGKPS